MALGIISTPNPPSIPVVDEADLYGAVTSELWAVVDPTHAAHRDVSPDVELLLEDISNLMDRDHLDYKMWSYKVILNFSTVTFEFLVSTCHDQKKLH